MLFFFFFSYQNVRDMRRVINKCSKNFIFDISYLYLIISQAFTDGEKNGPKFVEPIPNVTVTLGRDASLPCIVSNLGTYKVMWIHIDRQMVVTKHKYVVTRIPRYSISVVNTNTWVLRVTRVQQEDRGYYMCQVNTNPVISQVGYLQVTGFEIGYRIFSKGDDEKEENLLPKRGRLAEVRLSRFSHQKPQLPPVFIDDGSSPTVVVRENENVTLNCRAQGFPQPKIVWKREDERDIVLSKRSRGPVFSGESIHFEKVSRNDMASYLCIASNGVPPSLIKKIFISVEFSPIVLVTYQLIVRTLGSNVTLECHTEANPTAEIFWMRGGILLSSGNKYQIVISQNGYTTSTKLNILSVNKSDFGDYRCLSKNVLGETAGTIVLDEYQRSRTTKFVLPSTTPFTVPNNDLPSRSTYDEELWDNTSSESKSSELNIPSIYNKGSSISNIHYPKILSNLGSKFSIHRLLLIYVIIAFLHSF